MKKFCAALLLAAGCASAGPVVRLLPTEPDIVWRSGRAVITRQSQELQIAAAFDRQERDRLAFRLEVQNLTVPRIDLDASAVTYQRCKTDGHCSQWWNVTNPEDVIAGLDASGESERAAASNAQGLGAALILLDVFGSRHPHVASDIAAGQSLVSHHEQQAAVIDSERDRWEARALRRTTLFPTQGLAGAVYLPVVADTASVTLRVMVAGQTFLFPFNQTTIIAGG